MCVPWLILRMAKCMHGSIREVSHHRMNMELRGFSRSMSGNRESPERAGINVTTVGMI